MAVALTPTAWPTLRIDSASNPPLTMRSRAASIIDSRVSLSLSAPMFEKLTTLTESVKPERGRGKTALGSHAASSAGPEGEPSVVGGDAPDNLVDQGHHGQHGVGGGGGGQQTRVADVHVVRIVK